MLDVRFCVQSCGLDAAVTRPSRSRINHAFEIIPWGRLNENIDDLGLGRFCHLCTYVGVP